jgi:hypothetical protein
MIKKGFNLFTTSPSVIEIKSSWVRCCEVCTTPLLVICKPFCKYRNATVRDFLKDNLMLK